MPDERPENVPEQFWNAETKAVNTDALLAAYGEATKPATKPENLPDEWWDADKSAIKLDDLLAKVAPPKELNDQEKAAAAQALAASYGDFELPEGFSADPTAMGAAKDYFAGMGLNKDQAQGLIKMYAEQAVALQKQFTEDGEKAWKDLHTSWEAEIAKDPNYGGAKLAETKASISKLYDNFGTPELRDALKLVGADNNPFVFKFLAKVATTMNEKQLLQGGQGPSDPPKTLAERMYPGGGNNYIGGKPPASTET